ncbi:hypothetical protein [Haloglomus litoreum]|uniref:hypothetical protein n=1 Tax=Haloglomus litoreum TaxID=3034026 RepID=UPI0023E7A01F|nr:hypothetical protein [Haloglomus sp. DT116]
MTENRPSDGATGDRDAESGGDPGASQVLARREVREAEPCWRRPTNAVSSSPSDTTSASDAAEALVGSVIFAAPHLVEGGVFDVAD